MPAMTALRPAPGPWSAADFAWMFLMWAVMMVAMMLPSVTPMVLLYSRTIRHRASQGRADTGAGAATALFAAGYLVAWIGFSALATVVNWTLHQQGLLSSMMGSTVPRIGGLALVAAGLYQWTPLKDACLAHCRSPIGFLADHWREGALGTLRMGLEHGAYCIGCCWLLMALLFVLGVMNLVWILVLTAFVLVEKLVPHGRLSARAAGTALLAWGVWLVAAP